MTDADQKFFNQIITGDETWRFACHPETKRQSSEWVGETSPRLKKLKFQTSRVDKFFDFQGAAHKEFIQKGKTVSAEFYKGAKYRIFSGFVQLRSAVEIFLVAR